jgi:hypothetical protein
MAYIYTQNTVVIPILALSSTDVVQSWWIEPMARAGNSNSLLNSYAVSPQGTDFITQNQGDLTPHSRELACMESTSKTANIRSSLTVRHHMTVNYRIPSRPLTWMKCGASSVDFQVKGNSCRDKKVPWWNWLLVRLEKEPTKLPNKAIWLEIMYGGSKVMQQVCYAS